MFNKLSKRFFNITRPTLSHNSSSKHVVYIAKAQKPITYCNPNKIVFAKGDSAATGHFFKLSDADVLRNLKEDRGITVILPDDDVIESSHSAQLPTKFSLDQSATQTAILPKLSSSSLISLPQLCDNNCECLLTPNSLHVVRGGNFILDPQQQGTQVLYGIRNPSDRLWDIPIPQHTPLFSKPTKLQRKKPTFVKNKYHINNISHKNLDATINLFLKKDKDPATLPLFAPSPPFKRHQLNVIIRKRQLKKDLANFLAKSLFSPRLSTLKKAIKTNFLSSFPGLTEALVDKHLPPSVATEFGHLKQEKQHLQSTSTMTEDSDFFSSKRNKNKRHHLCYY